MKLSHKIAALVIVALLIAGCGTVWAEGSRAACDAPNCAKFPYWLGPVAACVIGGVGLVLILFRQRR